MSISYFQFDARLDCVERNKLLLCRRYAGGGHTALIRLEALGLIERCPDPKDRRIWRLRSTPAAEPILHEMKCLRADLISVMTKGIDPDVLHAMTIGLRHINENMSNLLTRS